MRKMLTFVALLIATTSTLSADWSPELAARYLDGRQKEWFAWKTARSPDGPCVACHTGMTYLLARPALRKRLGESQPTMYEVGLLGRQRQPRARRLVRVRFTRVEFFTGAEPAAI